MLIFLRILHNYKNCHSLGIWYLQLSQEHWVHYVIQYSQKSQEAASSHLRDEEETKVWGVRSQLQVFTKLVFSAICHCLSVTTRSFGSALYLTISFSAWTPNQSPHSSFTPPFWYLTLHFHHYLLFPDVLVMNNNAHEDTLQIYSRC